MLQVLNRRLVYLRGLSVAAAKGQRLLLQVLNLESFLHRRLVYLRRLCVAAANGQRLLLQVLNFFELDAFFHRRLVNVRCGRCDWALWFCSWCGVGAFVMRLQAAEAEGSIALTAEERLLVIVLDIMSREDSC